MELFSSFTEWFIRRGGVLCTIATLVPGMNGRRLGALLALGRVFGASMRLLKSPHPSTHELSFAVFEGTLGLMLTLRKDRFQAAAEASRVTMRRDSFN